MGSAGIYVCALAWTMLVHTKDVVLRGGMGLGYAIFLTEKQLYIGAIRKRFMIALFVCLSLWCNQLNSIWIIQVFNDFYGLC